MMSDKFSIDGSNDDPLLFAISNGNYAISAMLLMKGANPNIYKDKIMEITYLHVAAFQGNIDIVRLLVQYGADLQIKNAFGDTHL